MSCISAASCFRSVTIEVSSTADAGSDGSIIMNESSVSMCADREFRFVDPKSVRMGKVFGVGESQRPKFDNSGLAS